MNTFFRDLTGLLKTTPSYDDSLFHYFTSPPTKDGLLYQDCKKPVKQLIASMEFTDKGKVIAQSIRDILLNNKGKDSLILTPQLFQQIKTYRTILPKNNSGMPTLQQQTQQQLLQQTQSVQLDLVKQIDYLLVNNPKMNSQCVLNTQVPVNLNAIFSGVQTGKSDFSKQKNLSLLSLASLLGLEGVVAYLVYNGALPGALNDNFKDAGFILIEKQIKHQMLPLNKLKLILLTLCSVRNGVSLSRLAILKDDNKQPIQKSALHLLVENFLLPVSDTQSNMTQETRLQALQTLGLGPNATQNQIKQAYKQLALLYHPNKQGQETSIQKSQEQFIKIRNAYDRLVNKKNMTGGKNGELLPYRQLPLQGQSLQVQQKKLGYELLKFVLSLNSRILPNKRRIILYTAVNPLSMPYEISPFFTLLLAPPQVQVNPQTNSSELSEIVQLFLEKGASINSLPNPAIPDIQFNLCEYLLMSKFKIDSATENVLKQNKRINKACGNIFNMSEDSIEYQQLQQKYQKLLNLYATQLGVPAAQINHSLTTSGGATAKLRTFHFADNKKYSHNVFRAIKPINAGRLAFEFIRDHYRIGGKEIVFTIIDKHNKKHYKYVARNDRKLGVVIHAFK